MLKHHLGETLILVGVLLLFVAFATQLPVHNYMLLCGLLLVLAGAAMLVGRLKRSEKY